MDYLRDFKSSNIIFFSAPSLKSLYGLCWDMYVGIFIQIVFKVNFAKSARKL